MVAKHAVLTSTEKMCWEIKLDQPYVCFISQVNKSRELFIRKSFNLSTQNFKLEKNEQQRFVTLQINFLSVLLSCKSQMMSRFTTTLVYRQLGSVSVLYLIKLMELVYLLVNHACIRWYNWIHIFSPHNYVFSHGGQHITYFGLTRWTQDVGSGKWNTQSFIICQAIFF